MKELTQIKSAFLIFTGLLIILHLYVFTSDFFGYFYLFYLCFSALVYGTLSLLYIWSRYLIKKESEKNKGLAWIPFIFCIIANLTNVIWPILEDQHYRYF
ncbi:hypothetical protein [Crocinitomix catalasitica]|uniref:hypothetical protein n=1 Tax=Crocinitomix catalasitica TaxID=184607 RepID=UPI00048374ED|nr:hypothetical protein [Crocinitomix catalasitica]